MINGFGKLNNKEFEFAGTILKKLVEKDKPL